MISFRKFALVLLVVFVLIILLTLLNKGSSPKIKPIKQPTAAPVISKKVTPNGWKILENKTLGFSLTIPEEFAAESNGEYSILVKHPTGTDQVGPVEFFYVSVVPRSLFNSESGEVYNYSKSFQEKLLTIPVGEIKNLSDNSGQKDWYQYERLGDQLIGGRPAKVYLNQRPWEFPNGVWEYRYIFTLSEKIVLAGGYIMGGPSDTPLSLPTFEKIVNSLVLFD